MQHPSPLLRLFVYGTLKKGFSNHEIYCRDVLSVEPAIIRGRLYELPVGYPVVRVPEEDIFVSGTANPSRDVAMQAELAAKMARSDPETAGTDDPNAEWRQVHGELLTFGEPELHLPAIDELEEFRPGRPSLYRRVLVPAHVGRHVVLPAWVYVLGTDTEDLTIVHAESWNP